MRYLDASFYNRAKCLRQLIKDKKAKHREIALDLLGKMKKEAREDLEKICTDTSLEDWIKEKAKRLLEDIEKKKDLA